MADQGATTRAGRWAYTVIGVPVGGVVSYFAAKVFEAWGVLDGMAIAIGTFLKSNVAPSQVGWTLGLILFLAMYAVLVWRVWRPRQIHPVVSNGEAGAKPSLTTITPATARSTPEAESEPELDNINISAIGLSGSISNNLLTLLIDGYNGNEDDLEFVGVRGSLKVSYTADAIRNLSSPTLLMGADLKGKSRFRFAFNQPLEDQQNIMRMCLDDGKRILVKTDSLDIIVGSHHDKNRRMRLPLIHDLVLSGSETTRIGQIIPEVAKL